LFSGISKKVIFFSFLFINLLQPSKSAESSEINKNIHNQNTNFIWSKKSNEETYDDSSKNLANFFNGEIIDLDE